MYEKEISKGINLLNDKYPKWQTKINLKKLELSSCHNCIIGQLFCGREKEAGFWESLGVEIYDSSYGFCIPDDNSQYEEQQFLWEKLTAEWKKALRKEVCKQTL